MNEHNYTITVTMEAAEMVVLQTTASTPFVVPVV
jgi:hypothetical protein